MRNRKPDLLVVEMVEVETLSASDASGPSVAAPLAASRCSWSSLPPSDPPSEGTAGASRLVLGRAVVDVVEDDGFAVEVVVDVVEEVVVEVVVFLVVLVISHGGGRSVVVVVVEVVVCGRSSAGVPFSRLPRSVPTTSAAPPTMPVPSPPSTLPSTPAPRPPSRSTPSVTGRPLALLPPAPAGLIFVGGDGRRGSSSVMELTVVLVAMNQCGRGRAVCWGGLTAREEGR